MFELTGRVALVTGAGQGVGVGIAEALASAGATVIVNDVVAERAEGVAASIERATTAAFDVTDYQAVSQAIERAEAEAGPIDILVNNAGVPAEMTMGPFRTSDPNDWRPFVDINLIGPMNCSRAVVNGMCDRGWGRIITTSSAAGLAGLNIGVAAYGAGKAGGLGFMRHLAKETARHGVTANAIALGMMDNVDPSFTDHILKSIPTRRLGTPADAGAITVFLASDESSYITGQTITVDGGVLAS